MKSSFVLPAFSLILVACGSQSAVVGGECNFGYMLSGDQCVASAGTPIGNTSSGAPSSTATVASTPIGTSASAESSGGVGTSSSSSSTSSSSSGSTNPPLTIPTDPGTSSSSSSSGSTSPPLTIPTDPPVVVSNPPATDPVCDDTTVACHGACLPVDSDPQNCGACGRTCDSNICVAGVCQGATPGDIVVIGHDMSVAPAGSTHAKVFANAMTLPTTDPLRVLAFESDADAQTVDKTRTITFGATSRQVRLTSATHDMLTAGNIYAQWDVVLIDAVSGGNAAQYGADWSAALSTFTKAGGVLVGLDNGSGDLPTFFSSAGLLNLGMHVALPTGTQFVVSAPNDTVGAHLLSPYAAYGTSWGFLGADAPSTNLAWVVQSDDANAYPTVLHKVAR